MPDNEENYTTVFKADISDFSKSTQDLNRYIKTVNSEFANATAGMGKWSDSADGLKAKLTQLQGTLQAEEKKLGDLKGRYAELVAQGKENTKEAQNLAISINNQQASVTKINSDINHYTASLKELQNAGVSTKQELDALNKSIQEQANQALKAEQEELKKAQQQLEDYNKAQEEAKEQAKQLGDSILKGAVVGLAGIVTACVGAIAGLNGLVNDTKELRTQMGQLETAFTTVGFSTETATKTYKELNSVLGDSGQATEASQHLAQLATSEEELESLTHSLTGVYAQFGSSLPLESLAESASVTATLGEVNGSFADVLEFAGHNVDDFNAELALCTTEQERSQLITKTLNDIYGESATKYKEVNKEVIEANKVQDDYNQAMADIATVAQPAITKFKTVMVGVLQTILEKFKDVDIEGLIEKIANGISNLVDKVLPPLISSIEWILDNLDWLVPVLGTVIGLIASVSAGIKIYNTVANLAKIAQIAWNVAMTANPIGLIVVAIAGLVAGIVLLIKNWDSVREAGKKAWDGIKKVWEAVGKWFTNSVVEPIKKTFSNLWSGLTSGASKAWSGITSVFSKVGSFFKDTFTKAWTAVKNVFSVGGKIFDGIKDGIVSTFKTIVNGIITGINKVVSVPFNALNNILNRLKGIEILKLKPFSWVGSLNVPQIPKLAKGGVVDKATLAMIGEAGKEAVVPLENNTQWIQELANKINSLGGGKNTTVNNYFEGMQTTALEQHKAKIELIRALKYGGA